MVGWGGSCLSRSAFGKMPLETLSGFPEETVCLVEHVWVPGRIGRIQAGNLHLVYRPRSKAGGKRFPEVYIYSASKR